MSDWEDEYYDREEEYWSDPEEREVECKYCGEAPLYWHKTKEGWRLFDEAGEMHSCQKTEPEPEDVFSPIP